MDPAVVNEMMSGWMVYWVGMFVFTALMTLIGTWLITRGWKQ